MSGSFEHNHVRLRYESLGQGEPVVFCHGLGGDRETMKELVGPLPGRRLVIWDCRGHGESDPVGPLAYYNFKSFAEDLLALMIELDIPRAVIGGVSMGAAVSAHFAARWPERVRGLILSRPAWIDRPLTQNLEFFPLMAAMLSKWGPQKGLEEFRRQNQVKELEKTCPYTFRSLCQHFTVPHAAQRSVRLDRMPRDAPIEAWDDVKAMRMPVLVLGNENDLIHPLDFSVQWAERVPDGRLAVIESKARDERRYVQDFRRRLEVFLTSLKP